MIDVAQVSKRFGPTVAVERVSFRVGAGEVVGFLGPNGAGKSSLLRMLSTYLEPDEGTIRVAGHDTRAAALEVRASLGFLTEHNALYEGMRVDRWLDVAGRARGLAGARLAERRDWVVERCTLQSVLHKRIHECSKGFRQRIGLAAALIHDPAVIVLDEPTHGLDPLQVVAFRDFVRAHSAGRAVLFSSHIVAEVAEISDRLLLMHRGRLVVDAPVAAFRDQAKAAGRTLEQAVLEAVHRAERAA
jgi:ABC-2 type transport system ATP-binding protein